MAASPTLLLLRLPSLPSLRKLGSLRANICSSRLPSDKAPFLAPISLPRFSLEPRGRNTLFTCFDGSKEKLESPQKSEEEGWAILRRWDVPWGWQTILLTIVACTLSFILTGLIEASLLPYLGFDITEATLDEKTEVLFIGQLSVTAVIIGVIFGVTNTFRPFSDEIFRYDLKEPFKLKNGWLLWAGFGIIGALISVALVGVITALFNGEPPQRDTDALTRLLPIIGSSSINTAYLVGITGVLAPVLEETIFRGFLMVSLTKWVSTPIAVGISAAAFSIAHLAPNEFPQLFILGVVLGLSYAQTRNLMTPITIHAFWNSGIIVVLTFLQLQGYDLKELIN